MPRIPGTPTGHAHPLTGQPIFLPLLRVELTLPSKTLPVMLLGREDFFKEYSVDFSAWNKVPPIMRIERPTR